MSAPTHAEFIGGFLAFVREKKGISNADFVQLTDKALNYLWNIENGFTAMSDKRKDLILGLLGMSIEEFYAYMPMYLEYRNNPHAKADMQQPGKSSKQRKHPKAAKGRKPRKP
jgi:transcriptional regulator with XRE-family HTH domain